MSDFEDFYRMHAKLIWGLARSRTTSADQADDLTQETFLRAWQHFATLAPSEPLAQRAWLVRTLRNLATDAWRRQRVEAQARAQAADLPEPRGHAELRLDVLRALATLAEDDRELVVMRYLAQMNSREIGRVLGVPEGTVRRRLAECRAALAQRLSQWAPAGGRHA